MMDLPASFSGVPIIESQHLYEDVEDWSNCRSRSRAERRRKQGHRQNVKTVRKPTAFMFNGRIMAHPSIVALILKESSHE